MIRSLLIILMTILAMAKVMAQTQNLDQAEVFSISVAKDFHLSAGTQSTSIRGENCQLRSLEAYPEKRLVKKGSRYDLALKNYNPSAGTWVLIMRSLKEKVPYLTVYCFSVGRNFTFQEISNDLNKEIQFNISNEKYHADWIENTSKFLFWRPTLKIASKKNKIPAAFNIGKLSSNRHERSVINFIKPIFPIDEKEDVERVETGCVLSTLFESQRREALLSKNGFFRVGEYKIVNLDFNSEKKYLLIVGRNFFKNPMYAIIHCHGIENNFTTKELESYFHNAFTLHKINRPHW